MKISGMLVDNFWKGEARVRAEIQDGERVYQTKIFVKSSQIFDYSCSCAEGNSFRGPCAHGRALYEAYLSRERGALERPVSTSLAVRSLIREYTEREVARLGQEDEEAVRLFVRLHLSRERVELECRVGRERQYMIRDLFAFAEAVRTGKRVEYGKGLAFSHGLFAFASECRPLLTFVMGEVDACREGYLRFSGPRGELPSAMRYITLSRGACDQFFALMAGKRVMAEDSMGQERELLLSPGNPPLRLLVQPVREEGIRIMTAPDFVAFRGEERLYVALGDTLYGCDGAYTEAAGPFLERLLGEGSILEDKRPGEAKKRFLGFLVHRRDIPLFSMRVLEPMRPLGMLEEGEIDWEEYRVKKLGARFSFDCGEDGQVTMEPVLSYGEVSFSPLGEEAALSDICRDEVGEKRIGRLITRYFQYREAETGRVVLGGGEEELYRFLSEGLARFAALGEVRLSASFQRLRILPPPEISMGVTVGKGWLNLRLETEKLDRAELARVLKEYRQKKKYYRMRDGSFLPLSGDSLEALEELWEDLGISLSALKGGELKLPAFRALYLEGLAADRAGLPFFRDEAFVRMAEELENKERTEFALPRGMESVLREYQKKGFQWLKMLGKYGFGGILADDMGLGKTLQILALLVSEKEESEGKERPLSLVVCPASLICNWGQECRAFAPSLQVLLSMGPQAERQRQLEALREYDVVVTSYELLRRDLEIYLKQDFRFEILDEAQYIKNAATQNARAVKAIAASCRFALTGTPIENRLNELWSIFDYLMPGFLFSYRRFKAVYEAPIVRDQDERVLTSLRRLIRPFVLRRLKKEVLPELPEKLEKVVYSAAEGRQRTLYQARALELMRRLEEGSLEGGGRLELLSELTRLRQICCDPSLCYENYREGSAKLETCISLVISAVEAGHKLLLFSQFASMLDIIGRRLAEEKIAYHLLTGATPREERNRQVLAFQEDDVPVFLISLKAGGTGLNLTAADMVIHYDPWWNVAAQNQATDRAHRIGQEHQVTVYRLILKDTVEENILRLQESKKALAEQIVTEGMISLGDLGREELMELLSFRG